MVYNELFICSYVLRQYNTRRSYAASDNFILFIVKFQFRLRSSLKPMHLCDPEGRSVIDLWHCKATWYFSFTLYSYGWEKFGIT
jgi:hypothetical protein